MDAGGTITDPALYHIGRLPGIDITLQASTGFLGDATSFNRLVVDHGAHLKVPSSFRVGAGVDSEGNSILISGTGSEFRAGTFWPIGLNGPRNEMSVESGAYVIGSCNIGYYATSTDNLVTVTGTGTEWLGSFSVGYKGSGNVLRINGGAWVHGSNVFVGSAVDATGNVAWIEGEGTRLDLGNQSSVGSQGRNNRMVIREGAAVTGGTMLVGSSNTAAGNELVVDGSGSTLQVTYLHVGGSQSSSNTFRLSGGASLVATACSTGSFYGAHDNRILIEGAGSIAEFDEEVTIGANDGNNLLRVSGGAKLTNRHTRIGQGEPGNPVYGFSANNCAVVENPGSVWKIEGNLSIGEYGTGNVVEISDGALVTVGGTLGIDSLGKGGNLLQLNGGFLAVAGDQTPNVGQWAGRIMDARATLAGAFGYAYFADDAAAEQATGYPGLGGHTVLGVGEPRIPARAIDWKRTITNPNDSTSDGFPASIALRGNLALVGASGRFPGGAAYLFDVDSGAVVRTFLPPDPAMFRTRNFGSRVALTERYAVISAPDRDLPNAGYSGTVYVFDIATGVLQHELIPEDVVGNQRFGSDLSACGDIVLIGAYGDNERAGAAYLFDLTTGAQLSKLTGDLRAESRLGTNVALSETLAVVGAPGAGRRFYAEGEILLFDVSDPANPSAAHRVPHPRVAELAYQETPGFGSSLALEGDLLLAGTPGEDNPGASRSGAAYLFDVRQHDHPLLLQRLIARQPVAWDAFGNSVAISGDLAVISIPFADSPLSNNGGVTVWDINSPDHPTELGIIPGDEEGWAFGSTVALDDRRLVSGSPEESGALVGAIHSYILPDPSIAGSGPRVELHGQPVEHLLTISNPDPVDITNLELEIVPDSPHDGSFLVHIDEPALGIIEGNRWHIPRLAAGATAELRVSYTPTGPSSPSCRLATTLRILDTRELRVGRQDDEAVVATFFLSPDGIVTRPIDPSPLVDRQTGLLVQHLSVTNDSPFEIASMVFAVEGLPAGTVVWNAIGSDDLGRPLVAITTPIPPGATITLEVEFYSPLRLPGLIPIYTLVSAEPASTSAVVAAALQGPPPPAAARINRLANGGMQLEFDAQPGRAYRVEYSPNLFDWFAVDPEIEATSNRVEWIDRGPPATRSHPDTETARYYRMVPVRDSE